MREALERACDALRSIAGHSREFDELEDRETMVVRMTDKATEALKELEYPEHEKLQAIGEKSQVVGEFLEWLQNEKDLVLARYDETDVEEGELFPAHVSIQKLLAEFFDIDLNRLEGEKRQMLMVIRQTRETDDSTRTNISG